MKHALYDPTTNDGGLAACHVCHGAEGTLPTECPGRKMGGREQRDVYSGRVDFIHGHWYARLDSTIDYSRDQRQAIVDHWVLRTFTCTPHNIRVRALRFLEEAIELYQACGGSPSQAVKLLEYVFNRPRGTVEQEVGGVGLSLLALCAVHGTSADQQESLELDRVKSLPEEHFRNRDSAKSEAGFTA